MGKHHNNLEQEAFEAIVGLSFEFAILIDIGNGLCKILKKQDKKRIPYLIDGDYIPYKDQLASFVNYSVSKNSQKEAANIMSLDRIIAETKDGGTYNVFFSVLIPGGKIRYKKWRYFRLLGHENQIVFTREDVTDAVLSERDKVTGLVTIERMLVESRLILEKNKKVPFYFILLDIDGFSNYNQLFGAESGNQLLKHIATFLLTLRSENVVVGHLSSDNFVLLMPKATFNKEMFYPLDNILNAYNPDFSYAVSIGLASLNSQIDDIRTAQEQAQIANRSLKNTRGIAFAIYNKTLSHSVLINQSIVPLLRKGMLNHEFVPYYQPIIDSKTGKMVMAEALVRWFTPTKGMVSPNDFIPILEKNGFIGELDYYVRDQVCAFIKKRCEAGDAFPVSVNISRI
jgi:diguanylate cyclase (GGDEF)-like protein